MNFSSVIHLTWSPHVTCDSVYVNTHTLHMGYLDVGPGVGTRHLQGPKNPDGLNLGIYVFVYVYKVHMCIY